jgi:hypothetical protein
MASKNQTDYIRLIEWNRSRLTAAQVRQIQTQLAVRSDGVFGPITLDAVIAFQASSGLVPDGKVGRQTLERLAQSSTNRELVLDQPTIVDFNAAELAAVLTRTIIHESAGRANPYAAQNRNLEYEGFFDRPARDEKRAPIHPRDRTARHWASKYLPNGGAHIGLSWGIIQFTQDGGALGEVLKVAHEIDPKLFVRIMGAGSERRANNLLAVTTRSGSRQASPQGARSPRVQPVDGADLWTSPWIERFNEAATHDAFKIAQRTVAATNYLFPAIQIVLNFAPMFPSQEDLAVAFDLAVHHGPGRMPAGEPVAVRHSLGAPFIDRTGGTAATGFWAKAAAHHKRPVIASEVIRLMPASSRARRETIMRFTDELRCYDRCQLANLTRQQVKELCLQAGI